jgi:hypothetical protein
MAFSPGTLAELCVLGRGYCCGEVSADVGGVQAEVEQSGHDLPRLTVSWQVRLLA